MFTDYPNELANHASFYEMTPHEQQMDLWRRVRFM